MIIKVKNPERGFTLVELLVVIAILGVLAAIAIPNVGKFIGYGRSDVGKAEWSEMQNCIGALMADKPVTAQLTPAEFGNTTHTDDTTRQDITVTQDGTTKKLSTYINGGIIKCLGHYSVNSDGDVSQLWYPN